jgi:RIO kinase 1
MRAGGWRLEVELQPFREDGWLTDVLYMVKSGKEATVYCCSAGPRIGAGLVAAKVYRQLIYRSFKDDSIYRQGRVILDRRMRRAVQKKTKTGRGGGFGLWVNAEFETLKLLHTAGADVPRPYTCSGDTVLMEYVGDEETAAPPLRYARIAPDEAQRLFRRLMRDVELWLSCDRVHGDLSAFNVLYWQGHPVVIDFPQAVDARSNRHAYDLLQRDIGNVCSYFHQYEVQADPDRIARDLWRRYRLALL